MPAAPELRIEPGSFQQHGSCIDGCVMALSTCLPWQDSPDRTVSHHWGMGEVEGIEGQAAEYVEEENKISTHKKQQGVWIEINDDHIEWQSSLKADLFLLLY